MKSKDFLKSKGLLSPDANHFIIDFPDDKEVNLGELLQEYADQETAELKAEIQRLNGIITEQANGQKCNVTRTDKGTYLITFKADDL